MAGEGNRSRRKGRDGEAEVGGVLRGIGFEVRGLNGSGDFLAQRPPIIGVGPAPRYERDERILHVEVKRHERIRAAEWIAQAEREAPAGAVPVVSFRQSHGRWYALLPLEDLARLLA